MSSQWGGQNPQWGSQDPGQGPYQPMQNNYPAPGYPPQYAPPPQPPVQQQYNPGGGDSKSPYEGNRFKPQKRINDPIFLILFILQVSIPIHFYLLSTQDAYIAFTIDYER